MPEISVIVPVYNVELYLRKCLDSLLTQTFQNFEVLLINDGSTDGSLSICEGYCREFPEIFRLAGTQENKGLSAARNFGITHADGEFFCFVDSDDWISSDFLERMYCVALAENADLVVCGYRAHYETGAFEDFSGTDKAGSDIRRRILIGQTFACNKMFRRNLFEDADARFTEGICYEDLGTIPLLVSRSRNPAVVDAPLYHYRIGRPGAITMFRDERLLHIFVSLKRLLTLMPKEYFPEVEWMAIRACLFRYAIMGNHPQRKIFQKKIRNFLLENFPNWFGNKYLKKEKGLVFCIKKTLLRWNIGWLYRYSRRRV
jgi:glycosyltransferase involved in cell wall biosynthesis